MDQSQPLDALPFASFAAETRRQTGLRAAITARYRAAEPECVAALLEQARLPAAAAAAAQATATQLVTALRQKGTRGPVAGLMREYNLSSQEGIALMCLAEALLRIPDTATRDALIRDKIAPGDWRAHAGHGAMFVNAATWGLAVTGRLTATPAGGPAASLGAALTGLLGRAGAPVIRQAVDLAMRLMGSHFVTGETIEKALANSEKLAARGFTHSYDMLGEAAATAAAAAGYFAAYEQAIHAIGRAAAGRGIYLGPGISIKLSALHPRYCRAQSGQVMGQLLPRLAALATLARGYQIGLNIDAEEADRLDLSLDLLEAVCGLPALAGWNGLGFVVQAYQKRAPLVIDWLAALAARHQRRLMVRLVKGAYWDSEIKRAQVDGLADFPVFTRKPHTDVSYLACAKQLLAARGVLFPQFATHNAQTLAAILAMAGPDFSLGDYEFQCLHGMGEALYDEVVPAEKLGRPCRIYAPVGPHETLLAYLVRRLLENGANASFVNQIQNPQVPVSALVADPVALTAAQAMPGAANPLIASPAALFAPRVNAAGLDLSDEEVLATLAASLQQPAPPYAAGHGDGLGRPVLNPADGRDIVGHVHDATAHAVDAAVVAAAAAAPAWQAVTPAARAACLHRAAAVLEARRPVLLGLLVREAGKTIANAIAEIREAVDFLRYYAGQVEAGWDNATHRPLGPVACISPWNFPLAIFTGQVAAALAAGNTVLAKPAPETPLIAAVTVDILHSAGIPAEVLALLLGAAAVGARLVANPAIRGVVFTGSTAAAQAIQAALATRLNPDGAPVPLVAETGGQNAMIVDSSALPEQVVADVLHSAFDSAGQRCSALRVLCLQQDAVLRILPMLIAAMGELTLGPPDRLASDIGPVISGAAQAGIAAHLARLQAMGRRISQAALPPECRFGSFVAPAIVEIDSLADLQGEVFGPVLHVLRYQAEGLEALLVDINALGYGLTFGIHSRIDSTIAAVTRRIAAGNIYVNRNMVGAVVGSQPFGGCGLSGTGPKAGGPLYLRRLLSACTPLAAMPDSVLPGPAGECNRYETLPRGRVLCIANDPAALARQAAAVQASGNAVVQDAAEAYDAVLFAGTPAALLNLLAMLAQRPGPIVQVYTGDYPLEALRRERVVSTNTAAAGGNAHLLTLG